MVIKRFAHDFRSVALSYRPSFNMIGKFVFFGILISAPLAITGLKCYEDTNLQGGGDAPLTTCEEGFDKGCGISNSKK